MEPTTNAAPNDANAELAKLEQAVAEAGAEETSDQTQEEVSENATDSQVSQAFQELAQKKGFKSVDDLVKSYTHLESYSSQIKQERDKLASSNKPETASKSSDEYENLSPEQKQAMNLLEKVVEKVVSKSIAPIKERTEVDKVREEIGKVQSKFPDFKDYAIEAALQYNIAHPDISLEEAYKITSFDSVLMGTKSRDAQAAKSKAKAKAYTESASTAKGEGIDYSKLSLEEMESIIPKAGQFIDHRGRMRRD